MPGPGGLGDSLTDGGQTTPQMPATSRESEIWSAHVRYSPLPVSDYTPRPQPKNRPPADILKSS